MIHTAVSSTADGSVVIGVDMNVSDAEKELAKLKKKIENIEAQIKKTGLKKSESREKTGILGVELDTEKAKLQEIKDHLQDLKSMAKDTSLEQSKRDSAKAIISSVQAEYTEQRERVRGMQTEFNKLDSSVQRYDQKLKDLNNDLEVYKAAAGGMERNIAEGNARFQQMAKEAGIADQHIIDLNKELSDLSFRQKELESAGIGLGYAEYDQNAARISAINQELKEYKKNLTDVAAAEKAAMPDGQGAERTADSQARVNTYLEKTGALYQKINSMIGKTTEMSGVMQDIAASTGGKFVGAIQSTSAALGGMGQALSGVVAKAAPYLAIVAAVLKIFQKLWNAAKKFASGFTEALKRGASAVYSFGSAVAKNFVASLKAIGKFGADAAKKLNVFSKLTEDLSGKFKRIGSTIKSALVFSVIYQGLAMVRSQIGAYLSVNTQFMTALRRLQGALLTAFQPIYEVVVPALTALINILSRAIATVTQFFASLFGKTAKQAQNNAEGLYEQANATQAAGEAAEDASKQLAAFDEINKLEGSASAGGGGGASTETGPLFDFEYEETPFKTWGEAFDAFLDKLLGGIPKLRDAFKSFADWLNDLTGNLYEMFTFPGVLEKVKQLGRELADALNYLTDLIEWEQLGRALGAGLNLALNFLTSFIYEYDWMNLGHRLAEMVNGLVDEIDWKEFGRLLWAGFKIGLETLAGFLLGLDMPLMAQAASNIVIGFFNEMTNTIRRIPWGDIGRQIAGFLVNLDWRGMLSSVTSAIAAGLMAAVAGIRGFLDRIVPELDRIAGEIVRALIEFFRYKVDWAELARTIGDGVAAALRFIVDLLDPELFYEVGKAIGDFFINLQWVEIFGGLTQALANGINSAVAAVRGFLDSVKPRLKEIADGIAQKINEFVKNVDWAELGQTISDGIEAALDFMIELMNQIDWDAIGTAIAEFLENIDWDTLLAKWGTLMGQFIDAKLRAVDLSGALDVGMEIVAGLAKGMWNKFQESGGVLGWLKSLLVDPILNGVKGLLGIHSPSTVFAEIGGFLIAGLVQGISDTWHTITDFFSEKLGSLKQTLTDSWDNIKSTASAKWGEIKASLGAKWGEIKVSAGEKFGEIKDRIIERMEEVKEKDWYKIGKSIVDDILSGLESIWNSLTSWAGRVKDKIADALSGAERGGGFGSTRSGGGGFSTRMAAAPIPDITAFNIPALATGAVIPPNREFLAVLGDQKNGTNIESPVSEIENAVMRAMQKAGVTGGNQTVILQVDGRELGRATVKFGGAEYQRIGTRLVEAHT